MSQKASHKKISPKLKSFHDLTAARKEHGENQIVSNYPKPKHIRKNMFPPFSIKKREDCLQLLCYAKNENIE